MIDMQLLISGVIFGLFLRAPAKQLSGQTLDAAGYASWLAAAATQIQARGNAKPGDKTMVDAIVPASEAAQAAAEKLRKTCASANPIKQNPRQNFLPGIFAYAWASASKRP